MIDALYNHGYSIPNESRNGKHTMPPGIFVFLFLLHSYHPEGRLSSSGKRVLRANTLVSISPAQVYHTAHLRQGSSSQLPPPNAATPQLENLHL
jgi:hypothetical protein